MWWYFTPGESPYCVAVRCLVASLTTGAAGAAHVLWPHCRFAKVYHEVPVDYMMSASAGSRGIFAGGCTFGVLTLEYGSGFKGGCPLCLPGNCVGEHSHACAVCRLQSAGV